MLSVSFVEWLLTTSEASDPSMQKLIHAYLERMLSLCLDSDKGVQKAALSNL
jgi:hypothetical protein